MTGHGVFHWSRSHLEVRGRAWLERSSRLAAVLAGSVLLALAPGFAISPASAAGVVAQCNSVFNAAAAQLECTVDIANTIDLDTNLGSSVVTTTVCSGPPAAAVCAAPVVSEFPTVTTTVDQCNGSGNKGGSTIICSVIISTTVTGSATVTPATVNQCAGSGAGGGDLPRLCDSYDTTTGATVTQCNGSVNGGGAPARVNCTVGPSTVTDAVPVTVNQCNGSSNGGGALLFCSVELRVLGPDTVYSGPDLSTVRPVTIPAASDVVDVTPVVVAAPVAADTVATPSGELAATGLDGRPLLAAGALAVMAGTALIVARAQSRSARRRSTSAGR